MVIETEFAAAERLNTDEVVEQSRKICSLPFVRDFLDAIPNMALVLNKYRQIVFANLAFRNFVGYDEQDKDLSYFYAKYIGERPGEAVGCIRSDLTEGGCGTTVFCQTCGAVRSIINSQQLNKLDIQECRMLCGKEENPLDLRIWSRPLEVNGAEYTVFSVMDISNEKRRKALERIFFHDVLNTAGGVKGLADLLSETGLDDAEIRDVAGMLAESSDQLIEEISAQRMLSAAESGDLQVSNQPLDSIEIMNRVIRQFHSDNIAKGKELLLNNESEKFNFNSDAVLLRRVLINLVKNALEAIAEGGTVTLSSFVEGDSVYFTVHNAIVIPEDIQRQIFTRSFSTKGSGRGLGTYSIKLITEKYLHGNVSFISTTETGTIFTLRYPKTTGNSC